MHARKASLCLSYTNESMRRGSMSIVIMPEMEKQLIQASPLQAALCVLLEPMFWVICVTFIGYNICLQTYLMCLPDVSTRFSPVRTTQGVLLLTLFSVADLIGRIAFGWLSDNQFIAPKNISIICHLLLAICFMMTPAAGSLLQLQIICVATGLLIGIITVLWPILNVNYFGLEKLAIAIGFDCLFSGLESLLRPFLIGKYPAASTSTI